MRNIWCDSGRHGSAPSGPDMIADVFRGFHPRLFMLFASGELFGTADTIRSGCNPASLLPQQRCPSAKRMNLNSRGRQPTEPRRKTNTTLKGSNHEMSSHARRTSLRRHHIIRPLKSRGYLCMHSVGLTHGYSRCSPPVNRTSAARRREHHHSMLEVPHS
jgi:hypothetical protein